MLDELYQLYSTALKLKNIEYSAIPSQRFSVQGGIGTSEENKFLIKHYQLDGTGWGSPFLLVPEVTNVDKETLTQLSTAGEDDYYVSDASPLGILFNNFKPSSANTQRIKRLEKGQPGSPCTKKYLCTNTEFTEKPICTASRQYQNLKIQQIQTLSLAKDEYQQQYEAVVEKLCLCEGLCSSTYLKYGINKPKENIAVAICPGPNLAYFNEVYSLEDMVKHIYGKMDLLGKIKRPHVFIKELNLYIDYLQTDLQVHVKNMNDKKSKQLGKFKIQLQDGINYYKELFSQLPGQTTDLMQTICNELVLSENKLNSLLITD
ncbi:hypothetical protein [Mucilaginibacter antarcticus]